MIFYAHIVMTWYVFTMVASSAVCVVTLQCLVTLRFVYNIIIIIMNFVISYVDQSNSAFFILSLPKDYTSIS